jgi:cytochrome b561
MTTIVSRYHPALVALHWLLALLILAALSFGFFVLAPMPNSELDKVGLMRVHMIVGVAILALMAVRLLVRAMTAHPPAATSGNAGLDRLARGVHYAFYLLVVAMVVSGLTLAVTSGLNLIVFGGSTAPVPPDLRIFPARVAHGYIALALAALIALHIAAALYHQFGRRDELLSRMGFGRRDYAG